MALNAGSRLGPYEIQSPLGAGGMGEVYRAKDTRLDRTVAIKVLPADLAKDAERRRRFEHEARAVSSLNHPHICTLYDIGQQDGVDYLVMEHLEGQTLAERLEKGPVPTDQALRVGIQIADALDKAHRRGIVHRDLKPSNVMLTKTGAKLLDFGLAKTAKPAVTSEDDLSALATRAKPLTEKGTLLGTVQYMAPEQVEGREVDARTDIWALGGLLYETITGQRAFAGNSPASLIGAILKDEPRPIRELRPLAPPSLERLVKTCLAKDPDERWQSAHDVVEELKWIAESAPPDEGVASPRREWLTWILGAGLAVALLALAAVLTRHRAPIATQVVRFDLSPPEGTEFQAYLAVSPDGNRLAFTAKGEDGLDRLYVRSLDSGTSAVIGGTDGAQQPFWSPDGRSLGFSAEGRLKRVDIGVGAPQTICSVADLRGATWGREGVILFGIGGGTWGINRVAATGGTPEPLTTPDASETSHRWPLFLPDGRHFLYLVFGGAGASISVGSLDGQRPKHLLDAFSAPTYAAPGHLLFVRDGALRAQGFDVAALRLAGDPVTLAEPLQVDQSLWGGAPVSAGGDVIAYRSGHFGRVQLTWFDRDGRELGYVGPPGDYGNLALSPEGGRLVIAEQGSGYLTLVDLGTSAFRRLTFKPERVSASDWSPDGRSIAYTSNRNGPFGIFRIPATGEGTEEVLAGTGARNPTFSPDGRSLFYESSEANAKTDLWVLPLSGDRKPRRFAGTDATKAHASSSPNGRWVAYTSDTSGRAEVYVRAFPSGEGPWQISGDGGDQAQWRHDGHELFYVSPARRMMAVAVDGDGSQFKASPPKVLFRARMRAPSILAIRSDYVVQGDGQRFLVNKLVEDPAKGTITVTVNWAAKTP